MPRKRPQHLGLITPRHALNSGFYREIIAADTPKYITRQRLGSVVLWHQFSIFKGEIQKHPVQLVIILDVSFFLARRELIERRLRDINVAALNQFGHLAVEKCQEQRADMGSVDIRISHDDDPVIA